MASVVIRDLCKSFGDHSTICDVNLDISSGEFVVFVGPSGCGKSTLLRLIAGLEQPTSGEIMVDGKNVTHALPSKRGISMVFQSYALYPHMSVYDNMAFGLSLEKARPSEVRSRVESVARALQLDQLLTRKPRELSGGQRQRVAIGRAMVRAPKVFLLDEPLSNLDAALRVQMRIELARLHSELRSTMIYVTHDQVEAMTLADRIVVLNKGRIEQTGRPLDLYRQPDNIFVAGFLGSPKMNFLPVRLKSSTPGTLVVEFKSGDEARISCSLNSTVSENLTLGIRPEHVNLHEAGNGIPAQVLVLEHLGNETYAHLSLRTTTGELMVVRLDAESHVAKGDKIHLTFPAQRAMIFDEQGFNLCSR